MDPCIMYQLGNEFVIALRQLGQLNSFLWGYNQRRSTKFSCAAVPILFKFSNHYISRAINQNKTENNEWLKIMFWYADIWHGTISKTHMVWYRNSTYM